jgi:hypothetical protein
MARKRARATKKTRATKRARAEKKVSAPQKWTLWLASFDDRRHSMLDRLHELVEMHNQPEQAEYDDEQMVRGGRK